MLSLPPGLNLVAGLQVAFSASVVQAEALWEQKQQPWGCEPLRHQVRFSRAYPRAGTGSRPPEEVEEEGQGALGVWKEQPGPGSRKEMVWLRGPEGAQR